MSAVLLESIHAKAGLGRTCDASAAYYPLISGHQLGIKESCKTPHELSQSHSSNSLQTHQNCVDFCKAPNVSHAATRPKIQPLRYAQLRRPTMMPKTLTLCALLGGAAALVAPRGLSPATPRSTAGTQQPRELVVVHNDGGGKIMGGGFNAAGEPPIKIRGFSLATAALAAGALITLSSFAAFFTSGGGGGTASVSSLGFIYGIPTLLVGAALAYAELEPVPVTYDGPEAKLEALFERKANEAMRKVREDVTRHRYGDDAHLDTTTKALGLVEPGRPYPILLEVKLGETSKGELSYAMVFNAPEAPFSLWADEKRVRKYETFFGPDIDAEVVKVDAEKRVVAIVLATNGGTPGGSGLKDEEVAVEFTGAVPDALPARNRA